MYGVVAVYGVAPNIASETPAPSVPGSHAATTASADRLQHTALLTEIVAAAPTASTSDEERPAKRRTTTPQAQPQVQHQAPPPQRQYAPGPDPAGAGRFIGGVMGGMLR